MNLLGYFHVGVVMGIDVSGLAACSVRSGKQLLQMELLLLETTRTKERANTAFFSPAAVAESAAATYRSSAVDAAADPRRW